MGRAILPVVVLGWWLAVALVVATALSDPATSAPKAGTGVPAHVNLPGLPHFPIPTEYAAFAEARRAYRESDEAALEAVHAGYEWLVVAHGQGVLIAARDGDAVQVELLDGPHAGRLGWMEARQLGP